MNPSSRYYRALHYFKKLESDKPADPPRVTPVLLETKAVSELRKVFTPQEEIKLLNCEECGSGAFGHVKKACINGVLIAVKGILLLLFFMCIEPFRVRALK